MSRRFVLGSLLVGLLSLGVSIGHAQIKPNAWLSDQSGQPAPPCTVFDPATGALTFCSSTNPLPISGGGAGLGTSSGTSTTGFGKQWYPSTITGAVASGQQQMALFVDDLQVAFVRRDTGCGNCLQVAISSDGGVSASYFSTGAVISNSLSAFHRVPSATPRYLVSNIGGPLVLLHSTSLSGGWSAITGLANPVQAWASKPDGSLTLSYASIAGIEVCTSTTGAAFGSCVTVGATATGTNSNMGITYAGGTIWLLHNNAGEIWRSTNDGGAWGLVTTLGGNGRAIRCLATTYSTCLYSANDGNIYRSTDAGLTWASVMSGVGTTTSLADYGGGVVAALSGTPPIGLGTIALNAFSSTNAGATWFVGQTNGSAWDGTGVPAVRSLDGRDGRGIAAYSTSGGGTNVFAVYNPVTQPGGTLQSSAGGYAVAAPIQAGIILNAAPVTSAANTAAAVTFPGLAGSRICVRSVTLFSSAAGTATLTLSDGGVTVRNFGTLVTATSAAATTFEGTPILCGQTSAAVVVNIGAAGVGITTTTSVIADRYPN